MAAKDTHLKAAVVLSMYRFMGEDAIANEIAASRRLQELLEQALKKNTGISRSRWCEEVKNGKLSKYYYTPAFIQYLENNGFLELRNPRVPQGGWVSPADYVPAIDKPGMKMEKLRDWLEADVRKVLRENHKIEFEQAKKMTAGCVVRNFTQPTGYKTAEYFNEAVLMLLQDNGLVVSKYVDKNAVVKLSEYAAGEKIAMIAAVLAEALIEKRNAASPATLGEVRLRGAGDKPLLSTEDGKKPRRM